MNDGRPRTPVRKSGLARSPFRRLNMVGPAPAARAAESRDGRAPGGHALGTADRPRAPRPARRA